MAHLTRESGDAWRVVPRGLLPAVVVSVVPEPASESSESTDPQPFATDSLITRRRLRAAWPMGRMVEPVAAIIRTLPNDAAKRTRNYTDLVPPYLTREAVEWLVEKRIEHLVLDVPSLDRTHDDGHMVGHRLFFGLPPGSTARGRCGAFTRHHHRAGLRAGRGARRTLRPGAGRAGHRRRRRSEPADCVSSDAMNASPRELAGRAAIRCRNSRRRGTSHWTAMPRTSWRRIASSSNCRWSRAASR